MSKNEQQSNKKHFYRGLNIKLCEVLQVLTEAAIERCFEKINAFGILEHNK